MGLTKGSRVARLWRQVGAQRAPGGLLAWLSSNRDRQGEYLAIIAGNRGSRAAHG